MSTPMRKMISPRTTEASPSKRLILMINHRTLRPQARASNRLTMQVETGLSLGLTRRGILSTLRSKSHSSMIDRSLSCSVNWFNPIFHSQRELAKQFKDKATLSAATLFSRNRARRKELIFLTLQVLGLSLQLSELIESSRSPSNCQSHQVALMEWLLSQTMVKSTLSSSNKDNLKFSSPTFTEPLNEIQE